MGNKWRICLLLALMLAGCAGCRLAKPEAAEPQQQDRLIGVYVTREHLDLFDMESWQKDNGGRLWAVRQDDGDWVFEGMDGLGYYAYRYENGTEAGIGTHLDEGLVSDGMHLTDTDGGERVELRANLYVTAGAELQFYCNPVYQTADGAVYLTEGSGVAMDSGQVEGNASSMTLEDSVAVTEDGGSRTDSCRVEVRFALVGAPEAVTFLQMDGDSRVLRRERFAPGEVPEELTLEAGCAYVVAETEKRGPEGEQVVTRQIADAALPGQEPPALESFSVREDGLCLRRVTRLVSA